MGEVVAFHPHLSPIATALADEGVPVRVISRSMRVPAEDMRSHLKEAVTRGELIELPADDWPPTARRSDRLPAIAPVPFTQIASNARLVFKVTASQAVVLATLLTRDACKKEQLLNAVQQHRLSKANLPTDLSEPQLKLIDVMICHLRKKLKPHGVKIETVWGSGYSISRQQRDIAMALITGYVGGATTESANVNEAGAAEFIELAKAA